MMRSLMSRYRPHQSEFSRRYACWAINHGGWRRMKKQYRRISKRRLYRENDYKNQEENP